MMVPVNTERNKTAYTVTLDYRNGTTTGISAHDRALTSRKLAQAFSDSASVKPGDFCRPGHLCPLRYTEGGVRRRRGHTEASIGVYRLIRSNRTDRSAKMKGRIDPFLFFSYSDLCVAAGLPPAALLCELVDPADEEGGIASRDACFAFAKEHGIKVTTIEMLKAWREEREGPLATNGTAEAQLDKERGVKLSAQEVVGPNNTD